MKILMVLTSHDILGNTGRKTGFWLEEFAAPYFVFRGAGVELTLASPREQFCSSADADQMHIAERELSAFIRAVTELFGAEEAKLSAEDWLDESELMDSPPLSTSRNWRAVTIAASARLANRLAVRQHRGSDRRVGARIRRFHTRCRGATGGMKPL